MCSEAATLRRVVDGHEVWVCAEHCEASDRRAGWDRRKGERRMFPRPEGRRMGDGRRLTD